jgi:hypothetical protein
VAILSQPVYQDLGRRWHPSTWPRNIAANVSTEVFHEKTQGFTCINTRNPSEVPQRGHNKQKRTDLREVTLGLLIGAAFHLPLFHTVYAGKAHDSVEFRSVTEELSHRCRDLARSCEHITLIFDKGNNCAEAPARTCFLVPNVHLPPSFAIAGTFRHGRPPVARHGDLQQRAWL